MGDGRGAVRVGGHSRRPRHNFERHGDHAPLLLQARPSHPVPELLTKESKFQNRTSRSFRQACSSWSTASGLLRCRFATSTASLTAVVSTVAFSAASFSATSFSASAHRATAHAKPLPCSRACQAVLCVKALAVRAASPSEPCAVHSSVQSLAVCPMCGWCDVCPALRWHGARRCATFKCAMLETAVLYHTCTS